MIKYLGSKRLLVPLIQGLIRALPTNQRVCDLFTGTTRVAQALKRDGYDVCANDRATYSYEFALAFVEADARSISRVRLEQLISDLNGLPGYRGYYTREYSEGARYFRPENAMRIDAIRDAIDGLEVSRIERAILLTSLILAADRVDSTTGVQMAYLKQWAPRAWNPLTLRLPELVAGKGIANCADALEFVKAGGTRGYDVTYVDPPYNQHSYFGNYHIWESVVRHDMPDTYGVARKRIDVRLNRSAFNSSRRFRSAFAETVGAIESPFLVVSFSDEGFLSQPEILEILGRRGHVEAISRNYKRYVGAQIGIFNPQGIRVGEVSHLRNTEHLFVVGETAAVRGAIEAVADSAAQQTALSM